MCICICMCIAHLHITVSNAVQAEVITTLLTFAEACAHPNAKRLMFHGLTGPVNAVEVDGTFFIESDEAEAKAACSKTPELASEAAVAPKAAENSAAAAAALGSGPFRISYAAAASRPPVGPKPSAAGGFEPRTVAAPKFSADLERSTPAAQPAAVHAPLEVSICIMSIHIYIYICRCNVCIAYSHAHAHITPDAHTFDLCLKTFDTVYTVRAGE